MKRKTLLFFVLALALSMCVSLVACNANGNTVNKLSTESGITLDGAFENDSVLKAEHHAADSEQGKAAIAAIDKPYDSAKIAVFDISVSKNGEKVQPGGKVKITMPKPFESDGYVTYHVKGDNTVEELKTTVDGNNIYFETTGFSYFVVAGLVNAEEQHIHNYVEKVTDRNLVDNATCQRKAVYRLVCSICGSLGRETFEYGEFADHNLREEKGYDPRCERDGLTHGKRCINPGCTYTEQKPIPALEHDMQDVAAKEPTCTEIGWKAYKRCAHYCGKIEGYEEISSTGHSMTITVPRVEPTCEKWGSEEYKKCSNKGCDYHTDYNGLPALGHDLQWHDRYDPTCTEDGYWGSYSTCNRKGCDYSSKLDKYVDKALGHDLKHYEAKAPDCLPGWEAYDECQRKGCDFTTKVVLPANGKHSYVCDVCTTCNECNPVKYTREGNYIYFGHWPQTCERDETVIAKLNEMAGKPPLPRDKENPYNWESHEGTTYMWQKIVIYNGTKYIGVQMNDYRASGVYSLSSYIMKNGYFTFEVYWFKYEPIKWRILTTSGNSAYIMSDIALDSFSIQPNRKGEIRDGLYADYNNSPGVPDGTYANNWEYSFIRSWLNETFYNEVFNDLQKEIIKTAHLDNTARSSNPNDYPKYYGYAENAGKNKFADQCKDTDDKIFLLSLRDITTTAYGFNKDVRAKDSARNLQATDFAKLHGAPMNTNDKKYVTWYTRSPSPANGNQGYATFVLDRHAKGAIDSVDLVPDGGVVPALWITL
ncbi:MAG TPA: hypothetical protein DHU79_07040 [Clostridiales bacterium]|nr:hypothetical protein [Clostridiales bacterium]